MVDRQSFSVRFQNVPSNGNNAEEVNIRIREELIQSGLSMVNYGYHKGVMVIRLVVSNGDLTEKDLDQFFTNLLCIAKKIEVSEPV